MLNIGTTNFLINVPSLPPVELEQYSTNLFDIWDRHIEQTLMLPDYSISLEIEEGSVRGLGVIGATLWAIYMGIGNYGSFISGLKTIRSQVIYVSDELARNANLPFEDYVPEVKVRKRGGALAQLQTLFNRVQSGQMTAGEAMHEAERFLGDEASSSPEFMLDLKASLDEAPRFPKQMDLPYEEFEGEIEVPQRLKGRPSRPSKPITPSDQYRIEIWRESKKDKKNVKITKLEK